MRNRNLRAMTDRLAARYLHAYKAKPGVEALMGSMLSKQLGITEAPEEFFSEAREHLQGLALKEGLDPDDLKQDGLYALVTQSVMETARKRKMIK
jgi:hypothetical protein